MNDGNTSLFPLFHKPVLLEECIEGLDIKPNGNYVDLTFGAGGHSKAILAKLSAKGRLLAIDRDPSAEQYVKRLDDKRLTFCNISFDGLFSAIDRLNWGKESIDGILIDLGVSSMQLDTAKRGFSFRLPGPLDMRMDPREGVPASVWLADVEEFELARVLRIYGEEKMAKPMARAIIKARDITPIIETQQLAAIIEKAVPAARRGPKHPATRAFQAIRLQINQELTMLEKVLVQCEKVLRKDGRLAVISFHSLEDRLVKDFIRTQARIDEALMAKLPRGLPMELIERPDSISGCRMKPLGRMITPKAFELSNNRRSRSAKLRLAIKIES